MGKRRASVGRSAAVPAHVYDGVVGTFLERVALRAESISRVVGAFAGEQDDVDEVALVRIERDRSAALDRYRRTRDGSELERTMTSLDAAEQRARAVSPSLAPAEVVAYLRSLPHLWADAPETRANLAEALFDRVTVLGHERMTVDLSAEAVALGIADGMPRSLNIRSVSDGYGRGERI